MSDDAKVPLPKGAKAGWFTARDGLLYTEAQVRAYGDARERAARAAEREACIAALEAEANGFRGVRQWQAVAGIMACIDALRARAEGGA